MNSYSKKGKGLTITFNKTEITNLYRPSGEHDPETYDYVEVLKVKAHRYLSIALKEWFFLLKPHGYLIINYTARDELTQEQLEKMLWWLCGANYTIIKHSQTKVFNQIIIQKKHTLFATGDSIAKWSFGIVTNGDRDEWVSQMIDSIRKQKIPSYEIIICGSTALFTHKKTPSDIIYIPFNERADRGWITKKKNLICENARFENICVLHDRIVLSENWYKNMKKWGNAFELLGCVQKEENGNLAGDWLTLGGPLGTKWKISRMSYDDWDYYTYLSGQLTIIKKSIWSKVLWDENLYWNDSEDADISFRARDYGFIIRFNPYAEMHVLAWRHGNLPLKYNPSHGLLPKDMLIRRIVRVLARGMYATPILSTILKKTFDVMGNTSFYKHIQYH